ncbi:hypothetical protein C448_09210 [Halococcus morrhuae DSM 1307]|uniref:Uncharacterized protein n=1 Tax=Halococcus morrhuae DSM 1307 TaxID=931277 RepID=M0MGT2_HALMO|nr:hypothetical protein [Halococcus morrhuae]EMA43914.1 hypothetical protein C448_09210 [Halococcus morrhuae DSM 1307]
MSESTDDLAEELAAAHESCEAIDAEIAEHGEAELETLADAHDRATTLLDSYEERATGTGDFEAFIEFQESFDELVDSLDEELALRSAFEDANDRFDKRRLSASDFAAAREALAPVAERVELLDKRARRSERYREARRHAVVRRDDLGGEIAELERLASLSDVDLDAPIDDLREPIENYNERVGAAFRQFRSEASARDVLKFVERTEQYPLVEFRSPPDDLREYVETSLVGTESLTQLVDYADYSPSKLAHYVDDPERLRKNVAIHRSYLDGLDATALEIGWPPPPALDCRFLLNELVSIVGRFAPDDVVKTLHELRAFTREERYGRLQRAATAREELTENERERLAAGTVEDELTSAKTDRERIVAALSSHPGP